MLISEARLIQHQYQPQPQSSELLPDQSEYRKISEVINPLITAAGNPSSPGPDPDYQNSYFGNMDMEHIHYSAWLLGKRNWNWSENKFCYFDQKISNGRLHFAGSRIVRKQALRGTLCRGGGESCDRAGVLEFGYC